ncbi:uncharacterized protein TRUGW13939_08281 [Talaromyces rugulosus]|uniref:Zn(2)-C6 fungal-type domain-containing protein n=1 Tax=Talaromyces rugulosus TaxID=121627 RepID=A0A7H8R453_TALRU|nr:uncharacterized protein TRUGW13939_08281 [Talaromyces rugulosus]QKX61134.1 hypothetical protein TRUGW13939_08281 [Talaromyces rugulosus]
MRSVRHIKCDEGPGVCNNCTSTGRKCDGYDLHRLPVKKLALAFTPNIDPHPGWVTTTDERRCFSYFRQYSIPGLAVFFDSLLWQKIILQISHFDPAVYHAANMLGALHQDSGANKMRLSGENLQLACHRFALEQASRAYTHLAKRLASKDPQFREVTLVCCLLFVMSDLLLGRYDDSFKHLHSGLRILKETQEEHQNISLDGSLVRTFERLDIESAHFGRGTPFLFTHVGIGNDLHSLDVFLNMQNVADVHRSVTLLLNLGIPFLARCWPLSAVEIAGKYTDLFQNQQQILSLNYEFQHRFRIFYRDFYHTLSDRDQRGVDVLQLMSLGQILSLKTCLIKGPVPESFTPEYITLLSAHQVLLAKFSDRPTFTLDYGVIPGLWVVASQCPDYSIRLQAIHTLQAWPHCEGIINSNLVASMALEKLKAELRIRGQLHRSIIDADTEEELFRFLFDTLMSTQQATNWSFIHGTDLLQRLSMTGIYTSSKSLELPSLIYIGTLCTQ